MNLQECFQHDHIARFLQLSKSYFALDLELLPSRARKPRPSMIAVISEGDTILDIDAKLPWIMTARWRGRPLKRKRNAMQIARSSKYNRTMA